VTTTKVRVLTHGSADGYSRITELEAWGAGAAPAGADVRWLVTDQLGTPRMVIDKTGSLAGVARHDYLPFGEEIQGDPNWRTSGRGYVADTVMQKFTGYEQDSATGMGFAQARYYSPEQGRFNSADPLMASAEVTNPQTLNRYAYVVNSPVKFTDPTGMSPEHGVHSVGGCANYAPSNSPCNTSAWAQMAKGTGGPNYPLPNGVAGAVRNEWFRFDHFAMDGRPQEGALMVKLTQEMRNDLEGYATEAYNRGGQERILFGVAMVELRSWATAASQLSNTPPIATAILENTLGLEPGRFLPVPDQLDASAGASGGFNFGIQGSATGEVKGSFSFPAVSAYNAYVRDTEKILADHAEAFAQKYAATVFQGHSERAVGGFGYHGRDMTFTIDKEGLRFIARDLMKQAREAGNKGL
jgi:RHS repeat-associated protein